jgi:hypothetical protein
MDPICRQCADQEHGDIVPVECTCERSNRESVMSRTTDEIARRAERAARREARGFQIEAESLDRKIEIEKPRKIWAAAGLTWVEADPEEKMHSHETEYVRLDVVLEEISKAYCRGYNKATEDENA